MCLPLVVGLAVGALGAVQSISQYQVESQAASASQKAYRQQRTLNQEAANRAYQQTQLKLKGEFDQAAQKSEQLLIQRLQAQGATLAALWYGKYLSTTKIC